MKRLLLIAIILMSLIATSSFAAENQSIIFSGTYSVNWEPMDADSVWLYLAYYDTDIDSVLVSAQSEGWGGYYRYEHVCTNDSVWGWSGLWVYVDNSEGKRANEIADVTPARDSSYALHAQVDSVFDTLQAHWGDTINRPASILVASDNIGINADDIDGSFTVDDFDASFYIGGAFFVWTYSGDRTITGASDAFYEIVGDTIRPIFGDSIPAIMDTIYLMLDSLYAIMDSLATQAWWSTSDCEGIGIYTCTLYVTDTLNNWRVPWVNVSLNSQAENIPPRTLTTNLNGQIVIQLSDGDYRAACLNVMLVNNEGGSLFLDFTVDGAPVYDSLMGYLQSVGNPEAAEACSVYGWLYDVESAPVAGATIVFELISDQDTLYYDNVTYLKDRTIAESNSDGYWSISVVPNELLDTTSFYSVDIIRDHQRSPILEHSNVYVPDSATVKFIDLLTNFSRKGK